MLTVGIILGVLFLLMIEILSKKPQTEEKSFPAAKNSPQEDKTVGRGDAGKIKTKETDQFVPPVNPGEPKIVRDTFDIDDPDKEITPDHIKESQEAHRKLMDEKYMQGNMAKESNKERVRSMADYAHRVNFGLKSRFDPYK